MQWSEVKWTKQSEVEWGEVKCSIEKVGEGDESLWKRFIGVVKWWEVKDWGESVSELIIGKRKLQETEHSTVLLGCFYLLYML